MDLHKKPFDSGTIAKLDIFEDYAKAWLPTFIMAGVRRVAIFDFFAGQGYDIAGVPGSAMRILKTIKGQIGNIEQRRTTIDLYLNEFDFKKYGLLQSACNEFLIQNPSVANAVTIHYSQDEFAVVFARLLERIGTVPSLVYLDQNGIKAIAPEYFQALETKPKTDFLYFVSSSYFWRFGQSIEFKAYLDLDVSIAKQDPYRFIHRHVIDQIRKGLPIGTKLMLYPFSIKKGANIHGIIFGATHPLAVDKFLRIIWKKNDTNGEANFDIDEDYSKTQPDLWGRKKLTKLEAFEKNFREKVVNGEISNNSDALRFAYSEGHIGSHADAVLRKMKSEGLVSYDGPSPLITCENVFKLNRIIEYAVS
jgi:three-Cys-motif partner protein